jgi:hypothetical protein
LAFLSLFTSLALLVAPRQVARAADEAYARVADEPLGIAVQDVERAGVVGETTAGSGGPDVYVSDFPDVDNYGSDSVNGQSIAGFALGTTSCNIGGEYASWLDDSPDHPVIRQNLYRLWNNRFEHIGTSWVKHGFYATNDDICEMNCVRPEPNDGTRLLPGCGDPYTADLNGDRDLIGPSSDINAFTGEFPWPRSIIPTHTGDVPYRLQARHADLNPTSFPGAKFFVEGHYIVREDAEGGTAENNASHRAARVLVQGEGGCTVPYCLALDTSQPFQPMRPAIQAWKDLDPSVYETVYRVPGEGVFILAAHVTELSGGFWRYEYALYNLNSHRSARSFRVPIAEGAIVRNVGFHDVSYHSGEPWSGADWPSTVEADSVLWATTPFANNPNANAMRWSTLYNFRFEVNSPPTLSAAEVELFRPGSPSSVSIRTRGPVPCAEGCIAGDYDLDGDVDEADFAEFQVCYEGSGGQPSAECLAGFDVDQDDDVDLVDFQGFMASWNGP